MRGRHVAASPSPDDWRQHVFSEYDNVMPEARLTLSQPMADCLIINGLRRAMEFLRATGFRPMLFDLEHDG